MKFSYIKFLSSVPEVTDNLQKLRERLVRILLISGAIIGTFLYGFSLIPASEKQLPIAVGIYTAVYIWLLTVALVPRIPYNVRAGSMLFFLYAMGVVNIFLNGLNVDAGLFLLTFVAMTSLLSGPRGGSVAIGVTLVAVVILGVLFTTGVLTPPLGLSQDNPLLWIIGGIILLFMAVLLALSLVVLVYGLETNLLKSSALTADLEQAAESVQKSEERFRALIEGSADLIGILNTDGSVQYLSPSLKGMLGYEPEEVMGSSVFDFIHPEDSQAAVRALTPGIPAEEIGSHLELRLRHQDGTWRVLDVSSKELRFSPAIEGYVINCRDITDRRQAAMRIQRQVEQLSALRAIDTAINASLDIGLTLKIAIGQVASQQGIDAAAVLLLNPFTHILEYKAGRGFSTNTIEQTRLRLGAGYAGRAIIEKRTVHITNLEKSTHAYKAPDLFAAEGFVTYTGIPLIAKGEIQGVLEVFRRAPFDFSKGAPEPEWLEFLETLADQVAIAIDNAQLFTNLQRSKFLLEVAYDATIEGWSKALDLRDKETEGHTQRVVEMTLRLAQSMGINEKDTIHLRRGALLHDIGKIGIPDHILFKPGAFTDEEWKIMRLHPVYAYDMLAPISYLASALDIPYCHHEKWDGSGYPRGLRGEQIPLAARIFAVADVWDALTSDRPYRKAWMEKETLAYIRDQSGKHFDPQVVKVFLQRK